MSNVTPPPLESLPSPRALKRATLVSIVIAAVLVVVAVLPAERGIDPTGIGRLIGLTQMGEMKVALAQELVDDSIAVAKGRTRDSLAALGKLTNSAPLPAATATDTLNGAARASSP